MKLLQKLCAVHAPSGNEGLMKEFVLDYINNEKVNWKVQPEILADDKFQDCILLNFGKPRTAIFAHLDSIGFMVRYGKQLIKIGGPKTETGYTLIGRDSQGEIECTLQEDEETGALTYDFEREIDRGTELVFKPDFREERETVQCCYMDNRLGVWNALKVAETLENGIIAFSCWEEHGGGSVSYLSKHIYENYGVKQALISRYYLGYGRRSARKWSGHFFARQPDSAPQFCNAHPGNCPKIRHSFSAGSGRCGRLRCERVATR